MTTISIATFNCENLMMRCDFRSARIPGLARKLTQVSNPDRANEIDAVFDVLSEDDRTLTAQALAAARAEVCCLQEVENLVALTAFHNRYLRKWTRQGYPGRVLIEGNDGRGIDVAVLSRLPVTRIASHADLSYDALDIPPPRNMPGDTPVFSRDCLEVDVVKAGRTLTLFVCHLKSMHGGREETRPVREAETQAIRCLIEQRFADPATENWAVLGDMNDYDELDGEQLNDHALGPLIGDGFAVDLLKMTESDPRNRWTHYYNGKKTYGALDHILLSPALAARNKAVKPRIVRAGQPMRATRFEGRRFPGVGWVAPKASDHCPLAVTLHL